MVGRLPLGLLLLLILSSCGREREWHEYEPLQPEQWTVEAWKTASEETKLVTAFRWVFEVLVQTGAIQQYTPEHVRRMGTFVMRCVDVILEQDQTAQLVQASQFCIMMLMRMNRLPSDVPTRGPSGSA